MPTQFIPSNFSRAVLTAGSLPMSVNTSPALGLVEPFVALERRHRAAVERRDDDEMAPIR